MGGGDAFDLVDRNLVCEKEKEHKGDKLTEGVGLTSNGRDELLLVRFAERQTPNAERQTPEFVTRKTSPGQRAAPVSGWQEIA